MENVRRSREDVKDLGMDYRESDYTYAKGN
jgi:hypothetical protein